MGIVGGRLLLVVGRRGGGYERDREFESDVKREGR